MITDDVFYAMRRAKQVEGLSRQAFKSKVEKVSKIFENSMPAGAPIATKLAERFVAERMAIWDSIPEAPRPPRRRQVGEEARVLFN